jgi:hypothetical protein
MGKRLICSVAIGVVLALIAAASAFSAPDVVRVGNLILRDNGGISPTKLPRHRRVPVSAKINARYGTLDGSHPPATTSVVADIDRTILVNAKGLPVCRRNQLVARSTAVAEKACSDAIVGSGEGNVEVEFPEQKPFTATGPILLFNGGVHGGTTLLLVHAYVAVPAPTAVIVPVELTRINRGHYGMHVAANLPRIAGGFGSVTQFKIKIDRKFTYKGKEESYLSASCPTGHYYAVGSILFADGTALKITHDFPCTPRD